MPKRRTDYSQATLQDAVGWSLWCLQNTALTKASVFRKARERFGVPAAVVERVCRERLGAEFFWERAEAQMERFRPGCAARNGKSARSLRSSDRHFRSL